MLSQPSGICKSIKEWFHMQKEPFISECSYREIYPKSILKTKMRNYPAKYPKTLDGGYIAIIPEARVWGQNGAIISPDNKLIWDVSIEYVNNPLQHSIFKIGQLPSISTYDEPVADLTHVASKNYYHWMYEVLPRYHLIQKSGLKVDYYIINHLPSLLPIQNETLSHLGINETQIISTNSNLHIKAKKLILPSQPHFYPTLWAYQFLRELFLEETSTEVKHGRRIYISRKSNRRILNEKEILPLLYSNGFQRVELEKLSLFEQINLFSTAECIISPHGAGLTNLTFCKPGTKVMEIFPPEYVNSLYWIISTIGNLNYYYYIGESGMKDSEYISEDWRGFDNIIVNKGHFKRLLENLILN